MAEASISWTQDQFSCAVCLDLLKHPVTIPCGHSYCMSCITHFWNQKRIYSCPQCRQTFSPRPVLGKNIMLAEVVEKLKKTKAQAAIFADCSSGDVLCDVCTETKHKAVKSCLMCLNSYCENHLQQHENLFKGKRHNLMEATGRLQMLICPQHDRLLDIYCRTDQRCVCYLCTMNEHKNHDTVSAAAERTDKQRILDDTKRKYQQRMEQKEKQLKELRETVMCHKRSAQTAVDDTERIFIQMMRSIERRRSEVTQQIRDQEKTAVSRAEELLKRLEQEMNDLRKRDAELDQLSHIHDHITFIQSFQSLSVSFGCEEEPCITSQLSFDDVRKSVSKLKEKLEDFCKDIDKISERGTCIEVSPINEPKTRQEFLQYSCLFTLDTNTVNKNHCLSERNRKVSWINKVMQYPDHPDRFDDVFQVLCRESVCGRCYWEVEWSCSDFYFGCVSIAVSYKSISRKGQGDVCLFGRNDESWSLSCHHTRCSFSHNNNHTVLPIVLSSCRIGVYVDHSAGTLSFYRVSSDDPDDLQMTLIHRVQTTFTQPLYPGFKVGRKSTAKLFELKR